MHMSSQRYINAASEYKYICILIYNKFCSATFYNDPPMITHAVAQELGPQEVKQLSVCDVPQLFGEFGKCCANQTGALRTLRCAAHCGAPRIAAHRTYMGSCREKNDGSFQILE